MTAFRIIPIAFCVAYTCYYGSRVIAVILMKSFVYKYSLAVMTRYIQKECIKKGSFSLEIGNKSLSVNMVVRTQIMMVIYVFLTAIALAMTIYMRYGYGQTASVVGLTAIIAIMSNGFFAILEEFRYMPQILEYEGLDKKGEKAYFRDLFPEYSGISPDDSVMEIDMTDVDTSNMIGVGNVIVIFDPPANQ